MNAPASYHALLRALLRQPDLTSDACLMVAEALDEIQHPHDASPEGAAAREEAREVAEALRALAPIYSATPLPEAPARSVEDTLGTPPASHLWVHLTPPDDGRAYPSAEQVQELLEALRLPVSQEGPLFRLCEKARDLTAPDTALDQLMLRVRFMAQVMRS